MQFLILGGNGLVGKKLRSILTGKGHSWVATAHRSNGPQLIACDVLDIHSLRHALEVSQPDVVINATNLAGGVDFCEKHPDKAKAFHYQANVHIGEWCKANGAKMVLISTDYVFDGKHPPYAETDPVNPLNVYGKEKLAAERWMQKNLSDYLIIRTTNVFGWDPLTTTPNFLMSLYFKLSKREPVAVPSFLWGNPTHVQQLSETIIELCEKKKTGIYHVVGKSFINRYDWARLFCQKLKFEESLLTELTEKPTNIAPRPFESNLRTDKIQAECETPVEDVTAGLQHFADEMALTNL